jgi:hypothetical protein
MVMTLFFLEVLIKLDNRQFMNDGKVKLSLCLTKYHAMKMYGWVEV